MKFRHFVGFAAIRAKDAIRHSRAIRHLNGLRLATQGKMTGGVQSAILSCRAIGFSENERLESRLSEKIQHLIDSPPQPAFWNDVVRGGHPRYRDNLQKNPSLTRSILLKAPSANGEKGVLMMNFEYNWARLAFGLSEAEFDWFSERYHLFLLPSWSPTDYAALALMTAKTSGDVFVQSCNFKEVPKITNFHPRVHALPGLACDWINPDFYQQQPERPIDFLMIANWGEFKRHWDFFHALRNLPSTLRVVLVGQPEGGRDANFIRQQAQALGVPQKLEIHQSLPIAEVTQLQSQAKVSLIFSRREGSCVAFVESMFAGCAVGIRSDAHVGPLAYVNEHTGRRLRPSHLAEDLLLLLQQSGRLLPAKWAAENISCHHTHRKMNDFLRKHTGERGDAWTRDLAVPHWRPYPAHAKPEEAAALLPAYRELHEKFPKVFGAEFFSQTVVPS